MAETRIPDEIKILRKKNLVQEFYETESYIVVKTSDMLCPFLAITRVGMVPFFPEAKTVFMGILPLSTCAPGEREESRSGYALHRLRGVGCKLEPFTIFTKIRFTSLGEAKEESDKLISSIESNQRAMELIRKLNPEFKVFLGEFPSFIRGTGEAENGYSSEFAWFIVVSKLLVKSPFRTKDIYLVVNLIESVAGGLRHMVKEGSC
ncbi:MAG: hypothetical protein ACUVQY_08050 [Thermoproteota archaeon]